MKSPFYLVPVLALCAAAAFAAPGSDSYRQAVKAEKAGDADAAAPLFEHAARLQTGKRSAESWFRAGRNWIDAGNPKQSYRRAVACFQRVDLSVAAPAVARDTKTWISVLSRLVSAEGAAGEADRLKSALEDAAQGSKALQSPSPPTTPAGK